jgi:hypothetical protein
MTREEMLAQLEARWDGGQSLAVDLARAMEAADVQWEQAASALGFACAGALATCTDGRERLGLATLLAFGLLEVGRTGELPGMREETL